MITSAASCISANAFSTNSDIGFSKFHCSNAATNFGDFHSPLSALGLAPARIAAASSLTVAANASCSTEYFMGLPFAGVLRDSQFKAAGNPTQYCVSRFRGVACDSSAALCLPGVRAPGGLFLF